MDRGFGHLCTPQFGADSWFLEGLTTHYEAKLSPGVNGGGHAALVRP
jgi:hypothetical protein